MSEAQQNKTDTERVSFTVLNARVISSKSIFALVDVEMQIAGVSFSILGLQARRSPSGALTVFLPTYRDIEGRWRPAIFLPDELRKPMMTAVLEYLVDQGLAHRREIIPFHFNVLIRRALCEPQHPYHVIDANGAFDLAEIHARLGSLQEYVRFVGRHRPGMPGFIPARPRADISADAHQLSVPWEPDRRHSETVAAIRPFVNPQLSCGKIRWKR